MESPPIARGPHPVGPGYLFGWPISSPYGPRGGGFHGGYDIAAPTGTELLAAVGGTLTQGWDPSGGGNWSTLYGDDGRRYGYGHADRFVPGLTGHRVTAGQVIAYSGNTGGSTGPHLHFAIADTHSGPWRNPLADMLALEYPPTTPPTPTTPRRTRKAPMFIAYAPDAPDHAARWLVTLAGPWAVATHADGRAELNNGGPVRYQIPNPGELAALAAALGDPVPFQGDPEKEGTAAHWLANLYTVGVNPDTGRG